MASVRQMLGRLRALSVQLSDAAYASDTLTAAQNAANLVPTTQRVALVEDGIEAAQMLGQDLATPSRYFTAA